mgnify:CR=1 FL=1
MAWNLNQWYTLTFPTYGTYKLLVQLEELEEIPDCAWWLELENAKDGFYYRSRVKGENPACTYALTNQGQFCETGPNTDSGMANLVSDLYSTLSFSADILIVEPDQWLKKVQVKGTDKYYLEIFFAMHDAPLAPCEDGGEAPGELAGGPASFYFPVPHGTLPEESKMKKKKIRIIWTKPL